MKKIIFVLILPFVFSYLSCEKNNKKNNITPDQSRLKRVLWYSTINSTTPIRIWEYEYDSNNRLQKKYHYSGNTNKLIGYDTIIYNSFNKKEAKLNYSYANDSIGWLLIDSTYYIYKDGNLIHEIIYYTPPNSYQVYYKYEYDDSVLVKKYKYSHQQFESCLLYYYIEDQCVKETLFSDIDLSSVWNYTIHQYLDETLVKSECYSSLDYKFQIITYTYDENGNLILEESKRTEHEVEAPIEYVYRYEYY